MQFDLNIHDLTAQIALLTRQRCLLQALDQLATDWRADGGTATLTLVGGSVHLVVPLPSLAVGVEAATGVLGPAPVASDGPDALLSAFEALYPGLDPLPEVAPAPRDWSALELDRLRRMDAAGHPAGVIATAMGRATKDVHAKLHGLVSAGPAAPQSEPAPPLAAAPKLVSPVSRTNPNSWSAENDADLIRLRNAGQSWEEIGPALGRTPNACSIRFYATLKQGGQTIAPPISEPRTAPTVKGGWMPAAWTDAEDDEFLRLKVSGLGFGEISARMGRPVDGLKFRLRKKLKARYDAMRQGEPALVPAPPPAITAPPAAIKAPLTPAAPSAAPPAPPAPPAAVEPQLPAPRAIVAAPPLPSPPAPRPRPTAVPVALDVDLPTHIAALPLPTGWTHDLDIEMLELASGGMKEGDIAAFLALDIADLRARFDALTGYDRSSKVRRFPRADVLAHLQALRKRDQVAA